MRSFTLSLLPTLLCFSSSAGAQQLESTAYSGSVTVSTPGIYNEYSPYSNKPGAIIEIISGGTLTNKYGGSLDNKVGGTLNNHTGGTLINDGDLYNGGTLNNAGVFYNNDYMEQTGTLHNSGTMISNASLANMGTIYNTGTLKTYVYYAGNGTVVGDWSDFGELIPGDGWQVYENSAVVTIDGNFYKQGGKMQIGLGGEFDGGGDKSLTEFDWLDATGNVELAGVLNVFLVDSFEMLAGMSFEILRVGGDLTGQYVGLDEGAMVDYYDPDGGDAGPELYITYAGGDGNDVTLYTLAAVPEPAAILLALFGLALLPRRRRR